MDTCSLAQISGSGSVATGQKQGDKLDNPHCPLLISTAVKSSGLAMVCRLARFANKEPPALPLLCWDVQCSTLSNSLSHTGLVG